MRILPIPAGTGFAQLTEAVTTEYGQLIELVRAALREKLRGTPGSGDYYVEIQGIWPDRVVARMQGRLYSYGYSLAADNTVTITDGAEVVAQYAPVRESLAAPAPEGAMLREAADGSIEVTLIRAGVSGNRNYYPDATLREAVPMFEGVRVFVKSDEAHTAGKGKDVANLIGGIYGVRFVEGKTPDTGALVGTFRPIDPADAVVTKMTEAVKRGMQGLMGLSIDAFAKTRKRMAGGTQLREAIKFTKVHSVDLIVEPGAGGGLDRLTEAAADETPTPVTGASMPLWKQRLLEAIKIAAPAKHATIDAEKIGDDELVQLHEAVCGPLVPTGLAAPGTQQRVTEAQGDNAPVTRAEFAMLAMRQSARGKVEATKLPLVTKVKLHAQFDGLSRFTEAEVDAAIQAESDYLARVTESGSVRVPMFGDAGRIEVGDRSVVMTDMLDAFFDPKHKDHGRVQSIKECYVEMTGDRRVSGRLAECDRTRLAESLGSSSFDDVLGNSITRRMLAEYRFATDFDGWRRIASVVPVSDFRVNERTRYGGYGDLPAVAEAAGYAALSSPSDEKATYAATKRGGTEDVTLEMIKNDDVGAVRRVPMKLGRAAKRTLAKFAFDFLRTNPTVYDTVALFHATHANLFAAALDAAQLAVHRLAMLKQTEQNSADRIGVTPRTLVVPVDLQEAAVNLFKLSTNNEKTFVQSLTMDIVPVWYWTDANDWCTAADPLDIPGLEIGFLDGREEPELFVQDMPNVGSMFSNDKLTYKIRHVYGGAVTDYRAFTKAVVA